MWPGGGGIAQPEIWNDRQIDYPNSPTVRFPGDLRIPARHSEGFTIVWADGHAKWVRFGSTKPRQWTVQDD